MPKVTGDRNRISLYSKLMIAIPLISQSKILSDLIYNLSSF